MNLVRLLLSALCLSATLWASSCDSGPNTPDDGLPPDPGAAGKATVAGIDSDRDGVRDDVQRFIAQSVSDPVLHEALTEVAIASQRTLTDHATEQQALDALDASVDAVKLLFDSSPETARTWVLKLDREVLNTEARSRAYIAHMGAISGTSVSVDETAAASVGKACEDVRPAAIVYVNGMFNSRDEAIASAKALAKKVRPHLPAGFERAGFHMMYNQSEEQVEQLYEVARQRGVLSIGQLFAMLGGLESMPSGLAEALAAKAATVTAASFVNDEDLNRHAARYQTWIREGSKVVLVAHSQGNFYANAAYRRVASPSLGVISLATPDSRVEGGGPYVTYSSDNVIGAVRSIFPSVLPANATHNGTRPEGCSAVMDHNFVACYLNDSDVGIRIYQFVRTALTTLAQPPRVFENGPLTVTLTWGSQPDVDLHVLEPVGAHVYYADTLGESGRLDVDDLDGFGPEHYYTSCQGMQEGLYRIGVNYYSGLSPEVATVDVVAEGLTARRFTRPLPQARGAAGNASPLAVADVRVTRSSSGALSFTIEAASGTLSPSRLSESVYPAPALLHPGKR